LRRPGAQNNFRLVIPSGARDPGFCLYRHKPRFLAALGMTEGIFFEDKVERAPQLSRS